MTSSVATGDATFSPKASPAFTSSAGRYAIVFPYGDPEESVKSDPNGINWQDASSKTPSYAVQYADFTNAGEAFGTMKVFMPTRDLDRIKVDKEISVGPRPGRDLEVTIGSDGAMMWLRFIQDGRRIYKILAGNKNDRAKAMAFIESFMILSEPSSASISSADASAPAGSALATGSSPQPSPQTPASARKIPTATVHSPRPTPTPPGTSNGATKAPPPSKPEDVYD